MNSKYDGLEVVRIPISPSEVVMTTMSNCVANVANMLVSGVCVSEETGDSSCLDTTHHKYIEDFTPDASGDDW